MNNISLKVYDKEDKIKVLAEENKDLRFIYIYKYSGEIIDAHSFAFGKGEYKLRPWQAKYEFTRRDNSGFIESMSITNSEVERCLYPGELEVIKFTHKLKTGNIYENRIKYFNGNKYEVEFLNGEFQDIKLQVKQEIIKEYINKLDYGK
jgi:hypothetical protein